MSADILLLPTLLAETTRSALRWHSLPPGWVIALVLVPIALLIGWWGYRRETDLTPRRRFVLGSLRAGALFFFLLVLFGPYMELSEMQTMRAHLVVLLDTSDSMSTEDGYEDADAAALAEATGRTAAEVVTSTRLDLARATITSEESRLLERWTKDFRLHVYSFGSQLSAVASSGDGQTADATESEIGTGEDGELDADDPVAIASAAIRDALEPLRATEPSTRMGQAVATVLDTFRLRDEPVAGVIVISDGQDNAGAPKPLTAGRRAGALNVPIYAVGVGDPRSPQNISVSNLRAKEVVLARDSALFEFTVRGKGFEGRAVRIEMQRLGADDNPTGAPLPISPDAIVLEGGDGEQQIKIANTFVRPGTYALRIGIPPQPEERIKSDNWITHTLRVIDRKIRVLYVEGPPRWEFTYLSNALIRDHDTMLVHTLLLGGDQDTPQRATRSPGWDSLDATLGVPDREHLFSYDVLIIGDVDPNELGATSRLAERAWQNIHEFVEKGGGLIMLSGVRHNPSSYRDTPLSAILPVVIDRTSENSDPAIDTARGYAFRITPEGFRSPLMNVAGDPDVSKRLWEGDPKWRQFWSYPALRAKTLAQVLAVSADPLHENKFGRRPLIATMRYGRGRVLFIGVEELWRMRLEMDDRYFYRFYGEAVRFLATYRLLGGNERFKILTDRDSYALDDTVKITLVVLDAEYNPSTEAAQTLELDMPGKEPGTRETVTLEVPSSGQEDPGEFRRTIVPTRPGQYRLSADISATSASASPRAGTTEEPPEKLFSVVRSSLEGRDLLLDETTLRELSDNSEGGRYLHLWELPEVAPPRRSKPVATDVRPDDLWDDGWTLLIATLLLGSEWLLRKRYQLV